MLLASTNSYARYCATPESVGAIKLANITGNTQEVIAIKNELAKTNEAVTEFYAELKPNDNGYSAYLWHKNSFLPKNCSAVGNPGGLNRTYIITNGKVTEQLWWQ